MGYARPDALGRNIRSTASAQTTLGTRPTVAAGDSFILRSYRVTPSEVRDKRRTPKPSASLRERIKGSRSYEVSVVFEHLPLGAATPPDVGQLLTAAFGTQTIGGSDVVYTSNNSQAPVLTWLEFATGLNTSTTAEICEQVDGFVPDQLKISFDKDTLPLIEVTGKARKVIRTGRMTASATGGTASVTAATAAHSRRYEVNSVIGVGTSTGTAGAGHLVTAVNYSTGVLTVDPVITGDQVAVDVYPITLWAEASTSGSPTPQVEVTVDFGSDTAAEVTGMEIMMKRNVRERRVVGTQYPKDFTNGWRDVEGTISFEATRTDLVKLIDAQWLNVSGVNVTDLTIQFGVIGSPGSRLVLQDCEMDFAALELPEDGTPGTFTLPFIAKANSATAENEAVWTFSTLA